MVVAGVLLGDVRLQMGATLRNARLAYKTYGRLDQSKSNAIVYPTWYSGQHYDNEWLIGERMALDPASYFIIVPNMLGNGLSSSPSNTPPSLTTKLAAFAPNPADAPRARTTFEWLPGRRFLI
jgi:homoserine acetyltransferase